MGGIAATRTRVVVAGPGGARTIPGIIVSEIVRALAARSRVTRLEIDVSSDVFTGLHRAPSLAAAHDAHTNGNLHSYQTPDNMRLRTQMFRQLIDRDIAIAIAYVWPGIDNDWVHQFLQASHAAGASTVVLCASLPSSTTNATDLSQLAEILWRADHVIVGDDADATEFSSLFGSLNPNVESDPALSLRGRTQRTTGRRITAFLPRDSAETLTTLLSAFDAIPEAWVLDYRMNVVMRYEGEQLPDLVAASYHANYVELIGDDLATTDLEALATTSSALSVAEPQSDSRAFSTAIDTGIATVVLANSGNLAVGRGYVGGLLANTRHPASVHVALRHALRLEDLHFPNPDAWANLARRLSPEGSLLHNGTLEPVATN